MQKISFDAEDFPPLSYYYGNDDEDSASPKNKSTESTPLIFQDHETAKNVINIQPSDVAPVHQSTKLSAQQSELEKSGIDKSEWWKAPEFVPRTRTVQLSSNGAYVTSQQQQQNSSGSTVSVSQHGPSYVSGATTPPSQIPFQQAVSASQQISKTMPIVHAPKLTQPMPTPFPMMPPGALAPAPAPAFIPLPLPTPSAAGWPINAQSAASLAVLHNQLARVYAHNPRVLRGQHPTPATAYHNQKLQQLILQQQQQRQNQFQAKSLPLHRQQQSIIPFGPGQIRASAPGPAGPGIPTGYTANMTTIDAGLGRPIPAIVLKRKRKKKNKKVDVVKHQQKSSISQKEENQPENPDLTGSKSENQIPDDDDDEDETSSLTSPHLTETRRSEPDLTKMQHDANGTAAAVCDVLIGTADLVQQSCYYPNDLDLIQSATNHCVMITGSCPDLSTDPDPDPDSIIRIQESIMTASNHVNPFNIDQNSEIDRLSIDRSIDREKSKGQFYIAKISDTGFSRSAYGIEEFELDTNPVVRDAMRDLASEGMIRSKQVKELDRKVIREMKLEEKMKKWKDDEWSEPELDEDDTIFERLLKNEDVRQNSIKNHQLETNPGKGQKSLKEELEEGLMIFRNRGAKEYGRVPLNDDDTEENRKLLSENGRAAVHHTAIVHGSKRQGEMAKTELYDSDEAPNGSNSKNQKNSTIPRATFVESEMEDEERMRITVNALDALDVDGADTFLSKSHLRSMATVKSLDDVSGGTNSKRRFSFPDSVPLVPLVRSKNCCILM